MTLEKRQPAELVTIREPVRERVRQHLVARRTTAVVVARKHAWTGWRIAKQLPMTAVLLVGYSPRGAGRLVAAWVRYLRDDDTSGMRHQLAEAVDGATYEKVSKARAANLRARMVGSALVALPVLVVGLAWLAPWALGWLAALVVLVAAVKVLPKKEWWEIAIPPLAAWAAYRYVPDLAVLVPLPPAWLVTVLAVLAVVVCGWHGRPLERPLMPATDYADPNMPTKPTASMVVDALCRAGVPGMTLQQADRVHDETRIIAPGVATSAHGYIVEMELPPGVTVDMVVKQRAPFAAALRRDLSTVWPSGNPERHPGYLRVFLSHKPMNKARQPVWPVSFGKPMSYFDEFPMFTDEQLRWVGITLAGTHMAMGGASGSGKSVGLRQFGTALGFALDTDIIVFDGKRSGDLNPIRDLCLHFFEGSEPEDAEEQLSCLRWLVAERQRRAKFLASLPREENRHSKVTRELAQKYPDDLSPIVVLFDEVQEYTEYGVKGNPQDKKIRDEFVALLTKLARLARAAGISLVFVSQKPDASVLPSAIMGNCGIRVAFRVLEQVHNDQILGTSARKNGVDATMFTLQDRGIAWVRGGESADTMVARTWSEMADLDVADELVAKAYALRKAAGRLPNDDGVIDVDMVLDEVADSAHALASRGRASAHLRDLVGWLADARPDYGRLDVNELGKRLRNRGVETPQVTIGRRTTTGVYAADLQRRVDDEAVEVTNLED